MPRIANDRPAVIRRSGFWSRLAVVASLFSAVTGETMAVQAADVEAEVRAAATAYADAFTKGDYAALADQLTESATLAEGARLLEGRAAIVASIRTWRERHPGSILEISVDSVEPIDEPLARVSGVMRFTRKAGGQPVASRFVSLRVK